MVKVAASILSADLSRIKEQVQDAELAGADCIHVDIMDGVFVPNLSFGANMIGAVSRSGSLPVRAHLMVVNPGLFIDECARQGASSISVHVESGAHIHRLISQIVKTGKSAGVALNPGTPLCQVEWVLPMVSSVTVMTVNPGFSGQEFIPGILPKIRRLKAMIAESGRDVDIVVDGGVNDITCKPVVTAGASILVAGSYFYGAKDMAKAVSSLR